MTASRRSPRCVKHLLFCSCALAFLPGLAARAAAPAGYDLQFSDDFDTLDTTAWTVNAKDNNVTVAGGVLSLTANPTTPGGTAYTAGRVDATGFSQRFGYFEARIKAANAGADFANAFWLNTPLSLVTNTADRSSIDAVEAHTPSDLVLALHDWAPTQVVTATTTVPAGADLSADYHTYAVDWRQDNSIHYYFDGAEVWSLDSATVDSLNNLIPLSMVLSTAVLNPVAGYDGAHMDVDYVRAYDAPGFTGAASGDWGDDANWGDGASADLAAGGAHAKAAVFNRAVPAGSQTVTLSADKQVRQVYFDGSVNALTFAAANGASLHLGYAGAGGTGGITINDRVTTSQTFNVPIVADGPVTLSNFSTTPGVALNVNGGLSASAAGQPLTLLNTADVNVNGSIDSTIGDLSKYGAGTATLNAANAYSGTTNVQQGTLKLGAAGALPSTTAVTVATGATLDLNGFAQTIGSLSGTGDVAVTASLTIGTDDTSTTYTGTFSGSGIITKVGSGTLTLGSGTSFYTSQWVFAGGVTVINASTSVGGGTGSILNFDGGTLRITKGFATSKGGSFSANNGTIDVTAATPVTLNGAFGGGGGFTKTGTGTLAFGATNTYAGDTTVQQGTLLLNNAASLPSTTTVTVDGDGTLDINGKNPTVAGVILAGGTIANSNAAQGGLTLNAGDYDLRDGAVSARLGGSAGIVKSTPGAVVLSGSNTYTGPTTVQGGTLQLNNSSAISTAALTVTGGTLDIHGFSRSVASILLDGGSIIDSAYNNNFLALTTSGGFYDFRSGSSSARLGGTFALIKSGPGAVTMGGSHASFIGTTTVRNGTLIAAVDAPSGAVGAFGNSSTAVLLSDASTGVSDTVALLTGGAVTIGRAVQVDNNNPSGTTTLGGSTADISTFSGNVTLNRPVQLTAADGGTVNFTGVLSSPSGTFGVTKVGPGTVVLSNPSNSYSGGTTVQDGTLRIAAATALPADGTVTVSGGTLDLNGQSRTVASVLLAGGSIVDSTNTDTAKLGVATGGTLEVQSGTASARLSGTDVTLVKTTAGIVTLSGANNYTGGTDIQAGTLRLGATGTLPSGAGWGNTVVEAGGTLDIAGYAQTLPSFTLNGGTFADSAPNAGSYLGLSTGDFDVRSGTVNARLGSAAGLVKSGPGVATINAHTTYTGITTVAGGTLVLAGSAWTPATDPAAVKLLGVGGVDITGGTLIFDYGDVPGASGAVEQALVSALRDSYLSAGSFAGGAGDFRSSTADSFHGLGWVDDAGAGTVSVAQAWYGDLNLDGRVDADDYVLLDRAFASSLADPGWVDGDVNYDGVVDAGDYALVDLSFLTISGLTPASDPSFFAAREARFGEQYVASLVAAIPEPTSAGVMGAALVGVLARRRARRG